MFSVCKVEKDDLEQFLDGYECNKTFLIDEITSYKESIESNAKTYTDAKIKSGSINGSEIQEKWFPTDKPFHIFLSHSHKDAELAKSFAYYMKEHFMIDVFIDSEYWGYVTTLLKKIDKKYCWNKDRKVYSYDIRNITTSIVYPMLSMALMEMMDKTDVFIFLKSDNSTVINTEQYFTASSWIYQEISFANKLEKKKPSYFNLDKEMINEAIEKTFSVAPFLFGTDFRQFYTLSDDFFSYLKSLKTFYRGEDILNWIHNRFISYSNSLKRSGVKFFPKY